MFRVVAYGFIFRVCGVCARAREIKILSFINTYAHFRINNKVPAESPRTGLRRTSFVAASTLLTNPLRGAFARNTPIGGPAVAR